MIWRTAVRPTADQHRGSATLFDSRPQRSPTWPTRLEIAPLSMDIVVGDWQRTVARW